MDYPYIRSSAKRRVGVDGVYIVNSCLSQGDLGKLGKKSPWIPIQPVVILGKIWWFSWEIDQQWWVIIENRLLGGSMNGIYGISRIYGISWGRTMMGDKHVSHEQNAIVDGLLWNIILPWFNWVGFSEKKLDEFPWIIENYRPWKMECSNPKFCRLSVPTAASQGQNYSFRRSVLASKT